MTATMGHNNPPAYDVEALEAIKNDASAFIEASNAWLKAEVDSDEKAEKLADQIDGLRKLFKRVDEARKDAKKPHDDAGKEVQAAFTPVLDRITKCADLLKPRLAVYAKAKAEAEAKRKAEELAAAAAAKAEAERLAKEAEASGDIDAIVEAEERAKEAAKQEKSAARPASTGIRSASGAGRTMSLRKRKVCTITAINAAFASFREDSRVAELLTRLANERANSKDFEGAISGFKIEEVETVA